MTETLCCHGREITCMECLDEARQEAAAVNERPAVRMISAVSDLPERLRIRAEWADAAARPESAADLRAAADYIERLESERDTLKAALLKFGRHSACAAGHMWVWSEADLAVCDCGLAAALKGTE